MRLYTFSVAAIFLILVTLGCAVEQQIVIQRDGSGTADINITLHPMIVEYMHDLMESMSGAIEIDQMQVFDVAAISDYFLSRPGITVESIVATNPDKLSLRLRFSDIETIMAAPEQGNEPVIVFEKDTNSSLLQAQISRANFHLISGIFSPPDTPISVLIPFYEEDFFSADEYLELLDYAFEEYAVHEPVSQIVKNSLIDILIQTSGKILSQHGGELAESEQAVRFHIPFLKMVTLEEPAHYSLRWR